MVTQKDRPSLLRIPVFPHGAAVLILLLQYITYLTAKKKVKLPLLKNAIRTVPERILTSYFKFICFKFNLLLFTTNRLRCDRFLPFNASKYLWWYTVPSPWIRDSILPWMFVAVSNRLWTLTIPCVVKILPVCSRPILRANWTAIQGHQGLVKSLWINVVIYWLHHLDKKSFRQTKSCSRNALKLG